MDYEQIKKNFGKCSAPIEFAQRYNYFRLRYKLTEREQIRETLELIEELDLLGALYIYALKEQDAGSEYIERVLDRHAQILSREVGRTDEKGVYYAQAALLCLMHLPEEKLQEGCDRIYGAEEGEEKAPAPAPDAEGDWTTKSDLPEDTEISEEAEAREETEAPGEAEDQGETEASGEAEGPTKVRKEWMEARAGNLQKALDAFPPEIRWVPHYCALMSAIFRSFGEDTGFLYYMEVGLRKKALGYEIGDAAARAYFELLCSHRLYRAGKYFLDNFDGSQKTLGMETEDLIRMLYALPSPELIALGKWYMTDQICRDYTYEKWRDDVLALNSDDNCVRWMKLTAYYHALRERLEQGEEAGFEALLATVDSFDMFNLNVVHYLKQLVECFAFIVNRLVETQKAAEFLRRLEKVNINSYYRARYLAVWNQMESINRDYDYREIAEALLQNYSVADAVYIYFNSHLKNIIFLEDFVRRCSEHADGEIGEYFQEYPIWGRAALGSRLSSVRDKIYLTPISVATGAGYPDYLKICDTYGPSSRQAIDFNRRMIRSHQDWYSRNKEIAELIKPSDYCTFYIRDYRPKDGVFATDLKLYENVMKERIRERNEIFPNTLLAWLSYMQENRKYVQWNENHKVYGVMHFADLGLRNRVAMEILNTIQALQEDETSLRMFLMAITNAPLEEINEFRYIPTQRKLPYEFPQESYHAHRAEIIAKADLLLRATTIPAEVRKDIYLNTCIRKFYDMYVACTLIGEQLYLETADEPFVLSLKLAHVQGRTYEFTTQGKSNTFFSRKKFLYEAAEGETLNLVQGYVYLVVLKSYDYERGCFLLDQVDLRNAQTSQWDRYLRRVRDIKKINDRSEFAEIGKELDRFTVKTSSVEHVRQLSYELDLVFKRRGYSVEFALLTIRTLKKTNPFLNFEHTYEALRESFREQYRPGYERFLEDYREHYKSAMGFCDLFFTSYLRIFIPPEDFFRDLLEGAEGGAGYSREDLYNYCKYVKRYLP